MAKEVEEKIGADVNAAKLKALQATIDKIEKDYGKGTISLNGRFQSSRAVQSHLTMLSESEAIRAEGSLKSMDRNPAVRRRSQYTRSPRHRNQAE